jgi:hypothetical protein
MLWIKNNYTLIYQFVYFWQGVLELVKKFTLKFIIKDYYDYTIKTYFDLTKKPRVYLWASIGKDAFNIQGLTIHSILNIPI